MPITTKAEQLKKAQELEEQSKNDYRWWEIDNGKKLGLLEAAFKLDATDKEACFYAQITPDQLYYYQREIDKQFQAKKAQWKENPNLIARQELVTGLRGNPELALKYLERKKKDEFSLRSEFTGAEGRELIPLDDTRVLKTLLETARIVNATSDDTTSSEKK